MARRLGNCPVRAPRSTARCMKPHTRRDIVRTIDDQPWAMAKGGEPDGRERRQGDRARGDELGIVGEGGRGGRAPGLEDPPRSQEATMNAHVSAPSLWSRVQFGCTVTYHSLLPQLAMGLAWFQV